MNTPKQQDDAAATERSASGRTRRTLILAFWAVLVCCVVIGSLSPGASPLIVGIGRLHFNDKVMHFLRLPGPFGSTGDRISEPPQRAQSRPLDVPP